MGDKITNPDDLVVNAMGHCGLYQIIVISLIFLHRAPVGFHLLSVAVLAPLAEFNCSDPAYDKCDEDCPGHVFDHSVWRNTTVTDFDLVCARKVGVSIIQAMVMLGILVGSFVFGWAGDKFGRLIPICIAVTCQLITGVGAALVNDVYSHTFLRFMCSVGTGGSMVASFALFMEFTDKKYRTHLGVVYTIPVHVAHALLGPLSYVCRTWHCIQLYMSLYSICLMTYWCCIPESTRWLLARDKTERVVKILERGARCNKMPTEHIRPQVEKYAAEKPTSPPPPKCLDLLSTSKMRWKTSIMSLNWFIISMMFYAIAQYLGQIGGDIFMTITVAGLLQIPGNLLGCLLISIIGRKWTLILSYAIVAAPMLAVCIIPRSQQLAVQMCCCVSMAGAAMSFGIIYPYTGEIFPTVVRSLGVGVCSMWARVGSIISPFVMHLADIKIWLPPLFFGVWPIIGGLATFFLLPETKGVPLPDTIEEADQL